MDVAEQLVDSERNNSRFVRGSHHRVSLARRRLAIAGVASAMDEMGQAGHPGVTSHEIVRSRKDSAVETVQGCFHDRPNLAIVQFRRWIGRYMQEIKAEIVFFRGLAAPFDQGRMRCRKAEICLRRAERIDLGRSGVGFRRSDPASEIRD